MVKLIGGFYILVFLLLVAVPGELAAQSFFDRIFKTSNTQYRRKAILQKRYHCGDMDAYNKKRAYRKSRTGPLKKMFAGRTVKPSGNSGNSPVAEQTSQSRKTVQPSRTSTTSTPKPEPAPKGTPQSKPPVNAPSPPEQPPPPVAKKEPEAPDKTVAPAVVKKVPQLTRDALKKMTEDERRDTLLRIEPEIELTPLQFISNQDEFSVVNMDSFIQAMEYAQAGKIVLVEGHTDDIGRDSYNLDLSMKRAEKIRELLLSGGISDELISVIGYGETQPLVPNNSDKNRAVNRRIEFKIFSLPE